MKTPLYAEHVKLGGKIVDFAGWDLPVQYIGLKEEHLNTRANVGLFDVSHMGEIRVRGPKALETLQWLTTNDVSALEANHAHYSLLPNPQGGLVDDIIIYCLEKDRDYLVCVNASNKDKDFQWMLSNNKGADISDESEYWAQIAVQGPKALALVDEVLAVPTSAMPSFTHRPLDFHGHKAIIARTGYTGESGCEIFIEAGGASLLWQKLLEFGKKFGAAPVGLGARDTLRMEMKYSLYGHEIDDASNPFEAGLGWVVKSQAKDFIGKAAMTAVKDAGFKRKLIGFKMLKRGIPRQGYTLHSQSGEQIGLVTSGTLSPTLNESIGIGYVASDFSKLGTEIFVDIRGKKIKAVLVKTPFVEHTVAS